MDVNNEIWSKEDLTVTSAAIPVFSWGGAEVICCRFKRVDTWNTVSVRPHWRIYWNPAAGAQISDKSRSFRPDRGQFIAIPPGIAVTQKLERPFLTLFIHVKMGFPYDFYPEIVCFDIGSDLQSKARSLALNVKGESEFSKLEPHWVNHVQLMIYRVLCELDHKKILSQTIDSRVRTAMEVLRNSITTGVSNEELARITNMSKSSFLRIFRRETGLSPQNFLLQKRLEKAVSIMGDNSLSIDEISLMTGFCDRAYFSRIFKREMGVSPAVYRNSAEA